MNIKKKLKGKNNRKRIIHIAVMLVVVCAIAGSSLLYAKYYASRYNKGITVASNLYFSSDKLKRSTGITDINTFLQDTDGINKLSIFTNSGAWSSGTLLLTFAVQNFENSILYNDSNLDIDYKVEFVLLDAPVGATYNIVDTNGNKLPLTTVNTPVEMTGTVKGGSLNSNTYGVEITMTGQATDYVQSRVLVMAYPISPDYIYRPADENQEYRLLGILQGHTTEAKMSIDSAGFKVQEESGYGTSTWKTKVSDLSGFMYNVKTIGDVVVDSSTASKQQVKITWDNRYLQLDENDDNYLYAKEHDSDATLSEDEKYIKVDNDNNTSSVIIMALPYTSIDMTFYKGTEFDTELSTKSANDAGRQWFEGLVTAEVVE